MINKTKIPKSNSITYKTVSDVVPSQFIRKAVEDCLQKEYCVLTAEKGETTLMGSGKYYNSNGDLIVDNKNTMEVKVTCSKCFNQWMLYGKI